MKIAQECGSCGGTGLYRGFAEPKGSAVVCLGCDGQGWVYHTYNQFTGRKKKAGVTKISKSAGSFIATGVGAVGKSMSYEEFEKKIPSKIPQ